MEQVRIAIVEDEAPHAELLKQHIESWQRQQDVVELYVRRFCHAAEFFFAWEEESYDMIFLDIQMPGINGMETARKIRETDNSVKLVFTTGITDYLQEGYEVEAIRYLLKPITQEKVWQCLDKLLQEPSSSPQLVFQTLEGVVKISESQIEYLEARGHYTICHLRPEQQATVQRGVAGQHQEIARQRPEIARQRPEIAGQRPEIAGQRPEIAGQRPEIVGQRPEIAGQRPEIVGQHQKAAGQHLQAAEEIQLKESFNVLCEKLARRPFVRCHRSYLCNIAQIYRVERTEILLESGGCIPISRRMYETVVKAFIAYFRREGSGE